jgi:hypothetical protein
LLDRGDAQGLFEIPTPTCAANTTCDSARLSREKNLKPPSARRKDSPSPHCAKPTSSGLNLRSSIGREIAVRDVVEAVELQMAVAYDLKTSVAASGFVNRREPSASRK